MKIWKIKTGFTVVELIISISIVIILVTISFFAFIQYVHTWRDANRMSSLKNIQTGLVNYYLQASEYPMPDNVSVWKYTTGSINEELVYAWVFWENMIRMLEVMQTPKDPISWDYYAYGISANKDMYQLASTLDSSYAYVIWDYEGILSKNNYIYNVPSLLFTWSWNLLSSQTYFIINNGQNIPYPLKLPFSGNTQTTGKILSQLTNQNVTFTWMLLQNWNTQSGILSTVLWYTKDVIWVNVFGETQYLTYLDENGLSLEISSWSTNSWTIQPVITCNDGETTTLTWCIDPYWSQVVSLFHADAWWIVDEKWMTWTSSGTPLIQTTNVKYWSGSFSFNNTSSYINSNHDWAFGTNDFTVEAWVNPSTWGTTIYYDSLVWNYDNGNGWSLFIWYNGELRARVNSLELISSHAIVTKNTWWHVAFTRSWWTWYLFYNGVLVASGNLNSSLTRTDNMHIWRNNTSTDPLTWYLDELRITSWVARYTSNFTLPIQKYAQGTNSSYVVCNYTEKNIWGICIDTYENNVKMLFHGEGTNNSTWFIDQMDHQWNLVGTPLIKTTQFKYGAGSMYFDNTSKLVNSNTDWSLWSNDFTIEMWVYPLTLWSNPYYDSLIWNYTSSDWISLFITQNGEIQFHINSNSITTATSVISINTWSHIAVVRKSWVISIFKNWKFLVSGTLSTNITRTDNMVIGANNQWWDQFNGYIDELRVTSWIARYQNMFYPPVQSFANPPAVTNIVCNYWDTLVSGQCRDPYWANVLWLLNLNGTNGATVFTDVKSNVWSLISWANSIISTATKQFWDASWYFNDNGWIQTTSMSWIALWDNDFTIEFWMNPIGTSNAYYDAPLWNRTSAGWWITFFVTPDRTLIFRINGIAVNSPIGTVTLNTWAHVAVSRKSGIWYLFYNGKLVASTSLASTITRSDNLRIGINNASTDPYRWYIDDVRITAWTARYINHFYVPTKTYPQQ